MRLLIYGFGPYKRFKDNITQKILRRLPAEKRVKKVVFPVRLQKKQFIDALRKYKPDVVLGLGQSSSRKRLKIERKAVNWKRDNQSEKPSPIVPGSSEWFSTTLRLEGDSQASISSDAGDYVCNYSMFVILAYLKRRRLPTRFGFVHIPYDYSLARARRFLLRIVRKILTP